MAVAKKKIALGFNLDTTIANKVTSLVGSIGISKISLAANGYIKFTNNLLIQWGRTKTFTNFTYPLEFNTLYIIIGTKSIAANSTNKYYPVGTERPGNRTEENGICVTYTNTGARFYSRDCNDNGANNDIPVSWIAIGKANA